MAQAIKYNTGATKTTGCCIRKGNFDVGIVPTYPYGPTDATEFWAGYDVPSGGFVSFQNKAAQGPSIYSISGVTELVKYGENLNLGGVYNTPEAVIQRCAELDTIVMTNIEYPEIPLIDNCVLLMDFGYTASYPWLGDNIYDISGGEISGGTIYSATTGFWTSGTTTNYSDSYFSSPGENWFIIPPFSGPLNTFTINIWVQPGAFQSEYENLFSQRYSQDSIYTPENNCNFFIRTNTNLNGYEGGFRISNTDYTVDTGNITAANWVNVTLTYDGISLSMYLNRVFVQSTPALFSSLSSNNLDTLLAGSINGLTGNSIDEYFSGRINAFHIYNKALNSIQVEELYDAYSSRF
jgi:hypothetical protein